MSSSVLRLTLAAALSASLAASADAQTKAPAKTPPAKSSPATTAPPTQPPPPPGYQPGPQVKTSEQVKSESVEGAATAPLRDLNIAKTQIPDVLLAALADPYARPP